MKSVLALSRITFLEGIRNRSLYGIFLFALFIFGINIVVVSFFMRDLGKVTVDINLSGLSFSGLLVVLFVGLNLLAKDFDKKTVHLVLSRPFSRQQYILGKFLGLEAVLLASLLSVLAASSATVLLLQNIYAEYFQEFTWGGFYLAAYFIFCKLSLLNALVVLFSSIATSSFVTLIFSICSYVIGESIDDVVFYLKYGSGVEEAAVPMIVQWTIDVVSYLFPNLSAFDLSLEAAHGLPVALDRVGLGTAYALVYISLTLMLSAVIFRRREFN